MGTAGRRCLQQRRVNGGSATSVHVGSWTQTCNYYMQSSLICIWTLPVYFWMAMCILMSVFHIRYHYKQENKCDNIHVPLKGQYVKIPKCFILKFCLYTCIQPWYVPLVADKTISRIIGIKLNGQTIKLARFTKDMERRAVFLRQLSILSRLIYSCHSIQ